MKQWPFPGDGRLVRARKMCTAYRALAQDSAKQLDNLRAAYAKLGIPLDAGSEGEEFLVEFNRLATQPSATADVTKMDQRFSDWGEDWHAHVVVTYGAGDWIPAAEAGPLIGCAPATVNRYRSRGYIEGKYVKVPGDPGPGKWYYKVGDVYALSAVRRKPGWNLPNVTDTVRASGRSDPE